MNEQDSISGVWREALAIIRRYPSVVIAPGAVLGEFAWGEILSPVQA